MPRNRFVERELALSAASVPTSRVFVPWARLLIDHLGVSTMLATPYFSSFISPGPFNSRVSKLDFMTGKCKFESVYPRDHDTGGNCSIPLSLRLKSRVADSWKNAGHLCSYFMQSNVQGGHFLGISTFELLTQSARNLQVVFAAI